MARPSKPVIVLEMEGRSHRTKEELKTRQAGEAQTLSGLPTFRAAGGQDGRPLRIGNFCG